MWKCLLALTLLMILTLPLLATAQGSPEENYEGVVGIKTFYQRNVPSGFKTGMPVSSESDSLDGSYRQMQWKALEYAADALLVRRCNLMSNGYYYCDGFLLKKMGK